MKMDVLFFVLILRVVHLAVTNDPNMCGPGSCCAGYFLDNNICTECPPGTYGGNCSEECPEGNYGSGCKKFCPTECARNCSKSTGKCQENNPDQIPTLKNNTTTQPDTHKNTTNISIEKKIEDFLKDKLWIIAGASCLLVIISCCCIGLFFLCKICKGRQNTKDKLDNTTPSNQNQLSSYSERYQSDRNMHNNSTSPMLSHRAQNCGKTHSSTNKSKINQPEVEYSKPKPKTRYSLVRKLKVSQELTCPEVSDGDDFDSDEFDDYTDTTDGVEISGIPMNQSFKTFRSSGISKQNRKRNSNNNGHIW
ncbi:multiple epidermal growth factor-like domains protein 10 isoform X2 [Saccostrea cucullata]|uniref:multiple epidermal growth factor-like domains protein 10 isoform X2 n=1 Tax=Saccostrea cuccullata TaxID=36930 RepID=UPI002ED67E63